MRALPPQRRADGNPALARHSKACRRHEGWPQAPQREGPYRCERSQSARDRPKVLQFIDAALRGSGLVSDNPVSGPWGPHARSADLPGFSHEVSNAEPSQLGLAPSNFGTSCQRSSSRETHGSKMLIKPLRIDATEYRFSVSREVKMHSRISWFPVAVEQAVAK